MVSLNSETILLYTRAGANRFALAQQTCLYNLW